MGGNFDRGETAGGSADSYFDRQDMRGPEGVVPRDDVEFSAENPNIAKAVVPATNKTTDETAGVTTQADNTLPDVIEGSDSERTGTSWGLPGRDDGDAVATPQGPMPEGEGEGEAHPNRNTGDSRTRDSLDNVGAWGTMNSEGSTGSPAGSS